MTKFEQAVRTDFEPSRWHPQFETWLHYALSANARGVSLLDSLGDMTPDLRGKRHLDVGAGYGGACVAAARRGASSVGLELDQRLLGFAAANREDHRELSLDFRRVDALDRSAIEALGAFDFVTCDNVIEHVRSPERLVAHFRLLVAPGGLLFVTIPNAFSFGQIRKDCHYGQFGVSLLDPLDGSAWVGEVLGNPNYDVSDYFRFENYVTMFERHGLRVSLLHASVPVPGSKLLDDARALRAEFQSARIPESLRAKVERRLESHLMRLESDVARWHRLEGIDRDRLGSELNRDYCEELWAVVARRVEDDVVGRSLGVLDGFSRRVERRVRRLVKR